MLHDSKCFSFILVALLIIALVLLGVLKNDKSWYLSDLTARERAVNHFSGRSREKNAVTKAAQSSGIFVDPAETERAHNWLKKIKLEPESKVTDTTKFGEPLTSIVERLDAAAQQTRTSLDPRSQMGRPAPLVEDTEKSKAKWQYNRKIKLMDEWLADNDLNRYGDPKGTMYTGGTPLFNESTGVSRDRYEYVSMRYFNEPWIPRAEVTPIPGWHEPSLRDLLLRLPPQLPLPSVPSVPSKGPFIPPPLISVPSVPSKGPFIPPLPISVPSVPSKGPFLPPRTGLNPPLRLEPPISVPSVPSREPPMDQLLPVDVNDVEPPPIIDQVVDFLGAGGPTRNWGWVECEDAMSECSRKVLGKLSNMEGGGPVFDDDEDEEGVRSWRECEEAVRGCSVKMVEKLSSIREGRPIFN